MAKGPTTAAAAAETAKPKFRYSIANLCVTVQMGEKAWFFGIPNHRKLTKDGVWQYQAAGGGAMLSEAGKARLEKSFGATDFEFDDTIKLYDARFIAGGEHLDAIFGLFEGNSGKSNDFEKNQLEDIKAELCGKEFGDYGSILSAADLTDVEFKYVDTVRQPVADDGVGTSERAAGAAVPTRRLFRRYRLILPPQLATKFKNSKLVDILSKEEVATTHGGRTKGKTHAGRVIADNIF